MEISAKMRGLLIATVAAGAIAGCGDDANDGSAQTKDLLTVQRIGLPVFVSSLSKKQFQAGANGRCRESWADMQSELGYLRRTRSAKPNDEQFFAFLGQSTFLPHIQFWFDDISYLGAPRKDRVRVENLLKALQWAVFSGEELRISSPELMIAVFGSFNRLARAYGLDECIVSMKALRPFTSS